MRRLAVCVAVMFAAVSGWAATAISVPDGGSVELASDDSDFNNVYFFGRNCTLKLKGTAAEEGELFQFTSPCVGTNGAFTIDASELQGYAGIRWRNHLWATGDVVRVVGTDRIVFGSNTEVTYKDTNATLSGAEFSFLQADGVTPYEAPAGMIYTNQVTVAVHPKCPYEVSPDTWFWIGPTYGDPVGSADKPYEVKDGYKVGIIRPEGVRASKFVVNEGAEMSIRPCGLQWGVEKNWMDPWKWGGMSASWKMPIELNGGTLFAPCNSSLTVTGGITGRGDLVLQGSATSQFQGVHTFSGKVTVNCAQVVFGHTSPGDPANTVNFESATQGRLFLRPEGWDKGTNTSCRIGAIKAVSLVNNALRVQNNQTVTIGSISGQFHLESTGTNTAVVVESLAAGAKLMVDDGVDVTINALGAGAEVVLNNALGTANWTLRGPSDGACLKLPVSFSGEVPANAQATFGGKLELPGVLPFARVEVPVGGDVVGTFPESCVLTVNGTYRRQVAWQNKVALWLDADAPESVTLVKNVSWATPEMITTYNGNELAYMWKDCRPGQTASVAKNERFGSASSYSQGAAYLKVYPEYVTSGGPNNKPYLSFTHGNSPRMALYKSESLKTSGALETAWAIVVFGAQNSKPGTILSSVGAVLARDASYSTPIFTNDLYKSTSTYLDGAAVDPGTTGLKQGAWQIVSFDAKNAMVDGLNGDQVTGISNTSMDSSRNNANYAEVILFGEKPTEAERQEAERYLSEKWGVGIAHQGPVVPLHASGGGTISLSTGTKLAGVTTGTIELNGQRLELEEGRFVPNEAEISSERRVLWFDPSLTDAVQFSEEEGRTREIAQILPRGNAGVDTNATYYLQSAYAEDYATTNKASENRRPQLVEGTRGGSADKWIDFANVAEDNYPNNLMIRKLPVMEPAAKYNVSPSPFSSPNYKTIFVVLDTSRGGGTPFSHYAGAGSGDIIARGTSVNDPIWHSKCTDIIKNGTTWLDGENVNGVERGFNGRPELMTFQPAAAGGVNGGTTTEVKAFGVCTISTARLNQELMGEILAFNRVLPDGERADVEAYLMRKWLGKAATGYVDFRDATVTGAGTVAVGSQEALPKFGSDFAGTVELADGTLAFTLDATAAPQVKNAIKLGANTLKLPETVMVSVAVEGKAASGTYTLIEADMGDVDVGTWTLQVTGAGSLRSELVLKDGSVAVKLTDTGTVIFIR